MISKENFFTAETVASFLHSHYSTPVSDIRELSSGKHSQAFSYTHEGGEYVLRCNASNRGFLKDVYAYEHFSGNGFKIPRIYEIGVHDTLAFCISEKIDGESIRDQYNKQDFSSLPEQFEMIEKIQTIPPHAGGYGEWEIGVPEKFDSFVEFARSMYTTKDVFDWDAFKELPYFNHEFFAQLVEKIEKNLPYTSTARELLHGDFGNDNVFMHEGKISGIIDWERSRFGDPFLDIGRVVLYCPNREATVSAVLAHCEKKKDKNYRERIAFGVYYTMLNNYGLALTKGEEDSSRNYPPRIVEFEGLMGITPQAATFE